MDDSQIRLTPQGSASQDTPPTDVRRRIALPGPALSFLSDARFSRSLDEIESEFGFEDTDIIFLGDLARMVMGKELELDAYVYAVRDEFSSRVSPDQLNALVSRVLADHFVPLGDYLKPSAVEVARMEKLQLPARPYYRIYIDPLTYSRAVNEIASMVGFQLTGEQFRERLRDLLISRIKGIRIQAQVVEALMRPIDVGGVGMDAKMAEATVHAMDDVIARAQLMSEDEYSDWLAAQAERARQSETVQRPMTKDDMEIARIQAAMPKPDQKTLSELEKAIEITFGRVSIHPQGEYLEKRLRTIISSRLRDVRNPMELRQLLIRDTKVGGLAMEVKQAETVSREIEAAYTEFHESIAHEEKEKIETQLQEQKQKVEERRRQEAEEHARWFEEKIRTRKMQEEQQNQALESMRSGVASTGFATPAQPAAHPLDVKERVLEERKFGRLVPTMSPIIPSSASLSSEHKEANASGVRVSPATIALSQASAGSRPSIDGVTYAGPQLVGLVGELRSMSLLEFRRLSKNPSDAIRKIQQKIDILGQESFEKKVEGIKALQASPLQAAYLALVGESFRLMKPVVALAEEKRHANIDTLTPDEIGAIIQLNATLHF